MRKTPKPAEVEEEDSDTGEAKPNTRSSASYNFREKPKEQKRSSPSKSKLPPLKGAGSKRLGTVQEHASENKDGQLLNIVAGLHDDNDEVWTELLAALELRPFFYADKVINGDTNTYINREISISTDDAAKNNPDLVIAQRVFAPDGTIQLMAHKLFFGPHISLDRPYTFPRLGDEIPGVGCPELYCIFRPIRDWKSTARQADTSRFDENVTIPITSMDIYEERQIVFDFEQKMLVPHTEKPAVGISVSCTELFPKPASPLGPETFYPSRATATKRKSVGGEDDGIKVSAAPMKVGVKLIGMGRNIGDGEMRAGINVEFVWRG